MTKRYIPERSDIIWLDFEPTQGKEVGKYRPALVLSSAEYNNKTGLLICCPISTSMRGHMTEVPIDNLEVASVVVTTIIQTLAWYERKARLITRADPDVMKAVLTRLIPLLGAETLFSNAL